MDDETASRFVHLGWRTRLSAIATPLASIFGSGFLVIVSVLGGSVGRWSAPAMAGICAFAYVVGTVIRYNIRHAEPLIETKNTPRSVKFLSTVAQMALVPAYVISVTLYIRILASYALGFFNIAGTFAEKLLTTCVIGSVLLLAVTKGLRALASSEKWALAATVSIIVLLLGAFGLYDAQALAKGGVVLPDPLGVDAWHIATVLAGTLIVVQGFETTRYLGDQFDADTRIRASRDAQILSSAIYLLFLISPTPLMHYLPRQVPDNALMQLTGQVATWLTYPLLVAILSQFSAAIADAISGSGSLVEVSRRVVPKRTTYVLICLSAIALCWTTTTFAILALASRAFAFYYFIQCLVAISVSDKVAHKLLFGLIAVALAAVALAFVTCFATPVG